MLDSTIFVFIINCGAQGESKAAKQCQVHHHRKAYLRIVLDNLLMKAGAEVLDSLMMKVGAKVKLPSLDVGEFRAVIMLLYAACYYLFPISKLSPEG